MRAFATPQRGRCASCEDVLTRRAVYRMDEKYCCAGCADGGPCMCTYESDLADDGVDGLGLPFALSTTDEVDRNVGAPDGHGNAVSSTQRSVSGPIAGAEPVVLLADNEHR